VVTGYSEKLTTLIIEKKASTGLSTDMGQTERGTPRFPPQCRLHAQPHHAVHVVQMKPVVRAASEVQIPCSAGALYSVRPSCSSLVRT
jgi:hypothetical protein